MFRRLLDLRPLVARKSVLLVGPRTTGKSTLVRSTWPDAVTVDLLHSGTFRQLAARPERIEEIVRAAVSGRTGTTVVVVDEVQKVPLLLDEAHRLIEALPRLRFVLTGSSARKLRRGGTNLLAGRATRVSLFPMVHPERSSDPAREVGLGDALQWGGLPGVLTSADPKADLLDYVGLYLQEEVRAEGLVRSTDAFVRFLEVAAATNGEQVIFSNVARDAEVPARTVRDYYQVLEDTLLGHLLPAYRGTSVRKAMAAAKFYFFDVGVANALLGRFAVQPGTPEHGRALEHLVLCELRAALSYLRVEGSLRYWRSLSQLEVDFVVERRGKAKVAIEVKGTSRVADRDLRGLRALTEEAPGLERLVVSNEKLPRTTADGILILPVTVFLDELWAGRVLPG